MSREKIPNAKPIKNGDKRCNCCGFTYDREDFLVRGLWSHGLYYLNCVGCLSTLVVKGPKDARTEQ